MEAPAAALHTERKRTCMRALWAQRRCVIRVIGRVHCQTGRPNQLGGRQRLVSNCEWHYRTGRQGLASTSWAGRIRCFASCCTGKDAPAEQRAFAKGCHLRDLVRAAGGACHVRRDSPERAGFLARWNCLLRSLVSVRASTKTAAAANGWPNLLCGLLDHLLQRSRASWKGVREIA